MTYLSKLIFQEAGMQFWEEIEENDKFITKLNSNVLLFI